MSDSNNNCCVTISTSSSKQQQWTRNFAQHALSFELSQKLEPFLRPQHSKPFSTLLSHIISSSTLTTSKHQNDLFEFRFRLGSIVGLSLGWLQSRKLAYARLCQLDLVAAFNSTRLDSTPALSLSLPSCSASNSTLLHINLHATTRMC